MLPMYPTYVTGTAAILHVLSTKYSTDYRTYVHTVHYIYKVHVLYDLLKSSINRSIGIMTFVKAVHVGVWAAV
jgi:hypothetical protein